MIEQPTRIQHNDTDFLHRETDLMLSALGEGRIEGVAYDTAWVARLNSHYPDRDFGAALEWLRRHQHRDGTWGSPALHYHDRFVSTLSAILALRQVGSTSRDKRRILRGERALWRMIGKLKRDDSDTIGFPVLSIALAEEAKEMGLDVPQPTLRFSEPYKRKVKALLADPERRWRQTTLTFSFEALRSIDGTGGDLLEANDSIAVSPSATAAYLMSNLHEGALNYLESLMRREAGSAPAVAPIDIFESTWSLNHLRKFELVNPNDSEVQRILQYLWKCWSSEIGVGYSAYFAVTNVDDTASCFSALQWGGYPVSADVFSFFEANDHFYCFHGETNPSISAHVRLLAALRTCEDHPHYAAWSQKIVEVLRRFDQNGAYWWDKWHASPYYVNSTALSALYGLADDLAWSRYKWIVQTQNPDGGWGYYGVSTPEETAYCLEALLLWDKQVTRVNRAVLDRAAAYLHNHLDHANIPLWIGKSLYTPVHPVRAAVLSALYGYMRH